MERDQALDVTHTSSFRVKDGEGVVKVEELKELPNQSHHLQACRGQGCNGSYRLVALINFNHLQACRGAGMQWFISTYSMYVPVPVNRFCAPIIKLKSHKEI